jgi:(S)-citramalyl-CoA lyase
MNILKVRPAMLFTPATKPERFQKAIDSGANGLIIDLEDSIAIQDKDLARNNAFKFLSTLNDKSYIRILRINSITNKYGLMDLIALSDAKKLHLDAILYPKTESADELNIVSEILKKSLNDIPLIALIESGIGLANIDDTVKRANNLLGIMFGAADFAEDINASLDYHPLLYARSVIIKAASIKKIATYDTPYFDFKNVNGLEEETKKSLAMGFTGKAAIHPTQISVIKDIFKPSDEQNKDAEIIIKIYTDANGGACQYKGKMIDVPVYKKAKYTTEIYKELSCAIE